MPTLHSLPMTPQQVMDHIIEPALQGRFRSRASDTLLLAIGLQESRFMVRRQYGNGPAKGFWQFERGGGCAGVLSHPASRSYMEAACAEHGVVASPRDLWNALEKDDLLACKAARLLLWTDPRPIPEVGNAAAAWRYYLHNWRPGKPHPKTWGRLYAAAAKVAG